MCLTLNFYLETKPQVMYLNSNGLLVAAYFSSSSQIFFTKFSANKIEGTSTAKKKTQDTIWLSKAFPESVW